MTWNSDPPSRFADPSIWRKYQWPRVSSSHSSTVNSWVPLGKWPQKMIVNAHTFRVRLATALAQRASTRRAAR